jgi:DNA-binding CsgD family transcriptional regulator
MQTLELELSDPRVPELMSDLAALGTWEYLRRLGKPTAADALASATQLDLPTVHRALDRLIALGVARLLPASGKRKVPAYEVTVDSLRVRCDFRSDRPLLEATTRALTTHALSLMPPDPFAESQAPKGHWRGYFITLAHLTLDEVAELRRRLTAVVEFTDMLARKRDAGQQAGDPPLCNYGFTFRVEPLTRPALPLATVRFVAERDKAWGKDPPPVAAQPKSPLSDREYQVALALARGLNQREVAEQLGVKPSTVLTLTKRLYRKLRISRRAELVTRLQEVYGKAGDAGMAGDSGAGGGAG